MLCQILHRLDTFGKDDDTIIRRFPIPSIGRIIQQRQKLLIAGEVLRFDSFKRITKRLKNSNILDLSETIFLVQLCKPGIDAFYACSRT